MYFNGSIDFRSKTDFGITNQSRNCDVFNQVLNESKDNYIIKTLSEIKFKKDESRFKFIADGKDFLMNDLKINDHRIKLRDQKYKLKN